MAKRSWMAFAVLIVVAQTPAIAQLKVTELKGTYIENNVIRALSRVVLPAPPATAYGLVMLKIANMAAQKGYSRIAVVKIDDCGTVTVNRNPIAQTCKIFGQMLGAGEIAQPMGKEQITYYAIERRPNGVYVPSPEKATTNYSEANSARN